MSGYRNESINRLLKVLAALNTPEECGAFLDDLCTVRELMDMSQRFDTAAQLAAGKSYLKITDDLGTSTATISRVNRCLSYGDGGYRIALERLKEIEENDR